MTHVAVLHDPGRGRVTRTLINTLAAVPLLAFLATAAADGVDDAVLAGTTWELVEIRSMDDSTFVPDDPSSYTLAFNADGTVAVQSDCNRANGSWSAEGAQLSIGPLAATRALCPPGSLDERYRGQFEWVRSYVMEGGRLYLATMADGSIIEFRPGNGAPLAAVVLGEEVRTADPADAQSQVLTRLFDAYAEENGIAATEEEVNAYLDRMTRDLKAEMGDDYEGMTDDLTPEEAAELMSMRGRMARSMIGRWKLNRSLYEQYGGRVIFQQFGPEPLDAYRQYLESREEAGDFAFMDEEAKQRFWDYFINEDQHDFMDEAKADRVFATPPWEAD